MDADLVAFGDNPALLLGMQQRGHGRHVETRIDAVFFQKLQDARHADAVAVLAPGQAADRFAAVAQIAGLVVGVEGQRHCAARTARPLAGRSSARRGRD